MLSPRAYRHLGDTLKESGELLPVIVGDDTFYIFNCLALGEEELDNCEYEMLGDVPVQRLKLRFKKFAQSLTVFKSNYETCLTVFCNQRLKGAVDQFRLSGILFDENLVESF
ncbi:hypothetical protein [Microbulbifer taiwanensis]|uniref:Uncharacterized protein n=1 Tax=Microbulbifer taiwanensis TaxID=986746 RepID=A0ABW1YJY7_9GAMM